MKTKAALFKNFNTEAQTYGHIRGLGSFYKDGSESLEIHIPKNKSESLPYTIGQPVEVKLHIKNEIYDAFLRATSKNGYVWISPKIFHQDGQRDTLANALKQHGFEKNQRVNIKTDGKDIWLK